MAMKPALMELVMHQNMIEDAIDVVFEEAVSNCSSMKRLMEICLMSQQNMHPPRVVLRREAKSTLASQFHIDTRLFIY